MRLILSLLTLSLSGLAAEKSIIHCFAFTPRPEATEADFKAYYEANEKLAKDYPGILRIWNGKLRAPLVQYRVDAETAKKFTDAAPKVEGIAATRVRREHGACMEFKDAAAWTDYAKHPAHEAWTKVYDKVRVPGTTTYQILPLP